MIKTTQSQLYTWFERRVYFEAGWKTSGGKKDKENILLRTLVLIFPCSHSLKTSYSLPIPYVPSSVPKPLRQGHTILLQALWKTTLRLLHEYWWKHSNLNLRWGRKGTQGSKLRETLSPNSSLYTQPCFQVVFLSGQMSGWSNLGSALLPSIRSLFLFPLHHILLLWWTKP